MWAIPLFIFLFYSGWFILPFVYSRIVKNYSWGESLWKSLVIGLLSFLFGTAICDMLFRQFKGGLGYTILASMLVMLPYLIMLIVLVRHKRRKIEKVNMDNNSTGTPQKKRSVGVMIIGIWYIIYGFIMIMIAGIYAWGQISFIFRYGKGGKDIPVLIFFVLIPSLYHIIAGAGILKLRFWARRLLFVLLPIGIILSFLYLFFGGFVLYPQYLAGGILLFSNQSYWVLAIITYVILTRPKVKEMFK